MFKNLIAEKFEELKNDPSSPLYRIITGFLVSLIFSSYPIYIFVIYMWENGFYSYDVIGEGFSLSIFFYANLIVLIVFSLFMFGSITTTCISIKQELKNGTREKALFHAFFSNVGFIVVNAIVISATFLTILSVEDPTVYWLVIGISILLILLITSLAVGTANFYFKVVVLVMGVMYTLPSISPEKASILLSDGLRFFGAGNSRVSLNNIDKSAPFQIEANLIFLSPKYIYLKEKEDSGLLIVPRLDTINILYINEKKEDNNITSKKYNCELKTNDELTSA